MKENKTKIIVSGIVGILVFVCIAVWFICVQMPRIAAVKDYKAAVAVIDAKNDELDDAINKVQGMIDANPKVIDVSIIEDAKDICKRAGAEKLVPDKMPGKTEEIIAEAERLSVLPDYSVLLAELKDIYDAYEISIKQYEQMTNPSEEFVIQRLKEVDEIADVRAVTEENDPNGMLNKAGGYTATVYFESKNVNQANIYGEDLIGKGTDAGGAVEVYAAEEDAIKRNEYLSAFDGGIFSSGSHKVVGTVIIRTSDELTASKQKELEEKVIAALSEIR